MAQSHARSGQAAEALRQFDFWMNTHQKDARLARVLNERCWMRARLNIDLPLALQDCKQAVNLDDAAAAFFDSLGWTYLCMGEAAKAKKAFDGAITLEARPYSLYGRGAGAVATERHCRRRAGSGGCAQVEALDRRRRARGGVRIHCAPIDRRRAVSGRQAKPSCCCCRRRMGLSAASPRR